DGPAPCGGTRSARAHGARWPHRRRRGARARDRPGRRPGAAAPCSQVAASQPSSLHPRHQRSTGGVVMNTEQRTPGGFEERLLHELRSVVAAQPCAGPEPPPGRPRAWVGSPRRLTLVGGTAVLVAVAAAAGVPFLTGGAAPAFAVDANEDGTVTVEINSLRDAAGLQSKLREAGIRAVVQYLPPGKACKQPWLTPAVSAGEPPSPGSEPPIKGGVEHTS